MNTKGFKELACSTIRIFSEILNVFQTFETLYSPKINPTFDGKALSTALLPQTPANQFKLDVIELITISIMMNRLFYGFEELYLGRFCGDVTGCR